MKATKALELLLKVSQPFLYFGWLRKSQETSHNITLSFSKFVRGNVLSNKPDANKSHITLQLTVPPAPVCTHRVRHLQLSLLSLASS